MAAGNLNRRQGFPIASGPGVVSGPVIRGCQVPGSGRERPHWATESADRLATMETTEDRVLLDERVTRCRHDEMCIVTSVERLYNPLL